MSDIRKRINMLVEFDDIINMLNEQIERLERWSHDENEFEENVKRYREEMAVKTRVRDLIIDMAKKI